MELFWSLILRGIRECVSAQKTKDEFPVIIQKGKTVGLYKRYGTDDFVELEMTGVEQGTQGRNLSFCFKIFVHGFSATMGDIWFEPEELEKFCREASDLINKIQGSITLTSQAQSEFDLTVTAVGQGHFELKFYLIDLFRGNTATLFLELETQQIIDLTREINRSIPRVRSTFNQEE